MTIHVPAANTADAGALTHISSSWTFAAGSTGATGTHTVFTITGRVMVDTFTAFTSTTLTQGGATPTMTLGTATDVDGFIVSPTGGPTDLVANDWWTSAASVNNSVGPVVVVTGQAVTSQRFKLLNENIVLIIATQTITGGVLVFDVWYYPITSDGALVATTPA